MNSPILRPRWALAVALALLLTSVYLLTYTAKPLHVADENEYADAANSVLHFGRPLRYSTFWEALPGNYQSRNPLPVRQSQVEPAFLWLVIPWLWTAQQLEGVGVWHTLMSLNAFVTPWVCAALFMWTLYLTRSAFAASAVMLSLGLLTIFWPYAHTFFREQLSTLFLIIGAGLWWRGGWRGILLGLPFLAASISIKDSGLFAAPGLAFLLIPQAWWARPWLRRAALGVLGATVALCLILIYTPLLEWVVLRFPTAYFFRPQFPIIPMTTRVALHSYLLAAGGAFWGTSPILLLALPGGVMLWRKGEARLVSMCWLVMLGTALGYALLRGEGSIGGNWFGGTIWPHRFLLPAIPFIALLTAPIWDMLGKRKNPTLAITVTLFGIYSLLWSVFGALFPWDVYGFFTFDQSGGLVYWLPGMNVLPLSRVSVYAGLVGHFPTDIAWFRAGVGIYAAAFGITAFLAAFLAIFESRARRKFGIWVGISGLLVVVLSVWFLGLRTLYITDPYFQGEREDLRQLAELIRQRVPEGEVILLNQPDTVRFWGNAGKVGMRRMLTLPYHVGEMDSLDDVPPTPAQLADPASLLAERIAPWIEHVAARRSRLWVVMDRGSNTPLSVRPVERFMAERFYLVREDNISPYARLLEYVTTPAPSSDPATPPLEVSQVFSDPIDGESITLRGVAQPQVTDDVLTVSLAWSVEATPTQDVTVAVFFVNADNVAVRAQGIDSWLGGTFKTSTLIPPGGAVWDNRGIALPPDLPPGRYQVWVKVYTVDYATGQITLWRPPDDPTSEGAAVLPIDITLGG